MREAVGSSPSVSTTSLRTAYRSQRLFCKSHFSLILSQLLSESNPLSLGFDSVFYFDWGIFFCQCYHVATDGISFAATFLQKSLLTHSVAAPLRIEPAIAGLRFGFFILIGASFFVNASRVVADCVSFATAFSYLKQTPSLIRSVAPPSPAKPTALRGPQIQAAHRLRHAFFAKADGARIPLRLLFRKRSRCTFAARL